MAGSIIDVFFDTQTDFIAEKARDWRRRYGARGFDDAWKNDHRKAMFVRDVEELVRICEAVVEVYVSHWASMERRAVENDVQSYPGCGDRFVLALSAARKALASVKDCIKVVHEFGYFLENEGRFAEAEQKLDGVRARFQDSWPLLDEGVVKRAEGQLGSEDFLALGHFIDEIQGGPPESR